MAELAGPVGSAILTSVFPIVRMPPKMHNCKYENGLFLDGIEHRIGKAVHKAAMNIAFYERPSKRVGDNALYHSEDFD